jgi:hypothetical protein
VGSTPVHRHLGLCQGRRDQVRKILVWLGRRSGRQATPYQYLSGNVRRRLSRANAPIREESTNSRALAFPKISQRHRDELPLGEKSREKTSTSAAWLYRQSTTRRAAVVARRCGHPAYSQCQCLSSLACAPVVRPIRRDPTNPTSLPDWS